MHSIRRGAAVCYCAFERGLLSGGSCFGRDALNPGGGALLPRGNLTGRWAARSCPGCYPSGSLAIETAPLTPGAPAGFRVTCLDGGAEAMCRCVSPARAQILRGARRGC
jgi:hypothetical protein